MQRLLKLQLIAFAFGTLFSFYTVFEDFLRFYSYEGTLLKIKNCVVPNPILTPCFYGAFAFLAGLLLSFRIYKNHTSLIRIKKLQTYLLILTELSFVFAWSNFSYIFYKYLKAMGNTFVGCSGVKTNTPFNTPCFIGSLIFTLCLFLVFYIKKYLQKSKNFK